MARWNAPVLPVPSRWLWCHPSFDRLRLRQPQTISAARACGWTTVTSLRAILEAELAGFGAQTRISGCDPELTPSAGQDFSLILHELATNAAKYGSPSRRTGSIRVLGETVSENLFQLLRVEEGGPEIAAPPSQTNFGLRMLHQLAKGMSADLEMEFLPHGLRFRLVVPMARITNLREPSVASRA